MVGVVVVLSGALVALMAYWLGPDNVSSQKASLSDSNNQDRKSVV